MKKLRFVLYARVSTKKDSGLQNPETQLLRQLSEFAATEYVDRESGSKADRPSFSA